jgi:arylsulfatase
LEHNEINRGINHAFTTVMDILPTVLDLAGVQHPGETFRGRKVLKPRGKSWVPWLTGKADVVHDENAIHGWELFGQAAIRQGSWKAVWLPPPTGNGEWLLFDLSKDPGETKNLSSSHPDKLNQLVKYWHEYEAETGTILRPREEEQGKGGGFGRFMGVSWDDWGQ